MKRLHQELTEACNDYIAACNSVQHDGERRKAFLRMTQALAALKALTSRDTKGVDLGIRPK